MSVYQIVEAGQARNYFLNPNQPEGELRLCRYLASHERHGFTSGKRFKN